MTQSAAQIINATRAKAYAPRKTQTVSEFADEHLFLSSANNSEAGRWRTLRNPPLQEPMDCLSIRSPVQDVVMMFPVQFGKTSVLLNWMSYIIVNGYGGMLVIFPTEKLLNVFSDDKFDPLVEHNRILKESFTTLSSRNSRNTKEFKSFPGGSLRLGHAATPSNLRMISSRFIAVDELTAVANELGLDDPMQMLEERHSSFPSTYKKLLISSPGIKGICRTSDAFDDSDQRKYFMPCPHCYEMITFEWAGLRWDSNGHNVRFGCPECGCEIEEHQKTDMIRQGRWIPQNPGHKTRGYTINCLYYQIGLGPRWESLVAMFIKAANDPARLKTFINSRLAIAWEDPSMVKVKLNVIADRAEPYRLRTAPHGVCRITAGVDTQDNRLEVQIVGWGKHMALWVLDYVVLLGDPADDLVWHTLTNLLNSPIPHANGHNLYVQATAIDAGGHRTQAVYDYVRKRRIKRPLAIFGAVSNNAPVLSKPKAQDVNYRGLSDKRGVYIQHVGTVGIKNKLFGRMSTDTDKLIEERMLHFSDELPDNYFTGVVSETFNPRTNRFEKKRGVRNEPLDTLVYAFAAAYHPELRLHTYTNARWDDLIAEYSVVIEPAEPALATPETPNNPIETPKKPRSSLFIPS
ncbi:MAG: phage terminase large subunit family protein [Methylococcales bacterium]